MLLSELNPMAIVLLMFEHRVLGFFLGGDGVTADDDVDARVISVPEAAALAEVLVALLACIRMEFTSWYGDVAAESGERSRR